METRTCSKCGETKPTSDFYLDKGLPRRNCKDCHKAAMAERRSRPDWVPPTITEASREKNRERERIRRAEEGAEINAKRRAQRAADPERFRSQKRASWDRHKDRVNAERRDAWETDPEYRERKRAWDKANRSRVLENARTARYRRRVRMESAYVEDVAFDSILIRDCGVCGVCGKPIMETTIELDHIIPLAAGGTHERTNVQIAHRSCNRRKHAKVGYTLAA